MVITVIWRAFELQMIVFKAPFFKLYGTCQHPYIIYVFWTVLHRFIRCTELFAYIRRSQP